MQLSSGADYFGVADLTPARDFIHEQGGEWVSRYPRGIVIGMRLQDSLVDLLPEDDKAAAILYKHNSYDVVNQVPRPDCTPGCKHAPACGIWCLSCTSIKED